MIITKSNIQPENIIKMGKFLIMFHVKKKKRKVSSLTKAYGIMWLIKIQM